MIAQGRLVELAITDLAMDGIGRVLNRVAFVPNGVPGDRLSVRLTEERKDFARGRIEEIVEASPRRVEPKCPVAWLCGGCQWQFVDRDLQLESKRNQVVQLLKKNGGLRDVHVDPILGSQPLNYRNKVSYPLSCDLQGKVVSGYYERGTHTVVDIDECPLQDVRLDPMLKGIKGDILANGWSIYNKDLHIGDLRHLSMRIGRRSGEALVTLVSTTSHIKSLDKIAREWMKKYPLLVGVCLNINKSKSTLILGKETMCVDGRDYIYEEMQGVKFKIGPTTFFQVNTEQAERMLGVIMDGINLNGNEMILDAYCGIGTLSLPIAKAYPNVEVLGIESMEESVLQARQNAVDNGIGNARYEVGKVEKSLPKIIKSKKFVPDIVLIDPPRKGCERKVLETLLHTKPHRIVYVSCNPATLARDLSFLYGSGEKGYEIERVQPIDFFPQTYHVESVAFLKLHS